MYYAVLNRAIFLHDDFEDLMLLAKLANFLLAKKKKRCFAVADQLS